MSFRLKTILGIALIEAILLLILVGSSHYLLRSSNEQGLRERATTALQLFDATIKGAVLANDLAELESSVEHLLSNPGVRYVRILDRNQAVLAEGGDPAALARPPRINSELDFNDPDGLYDRELSIRVAGETFGLTQMGFAIEGQRELIADAWRWTATIAVLEIALVALFSYILGSFLTGQLGILTAASREVANGRLGHQVEVRGKDELAETARAFNRMSEELAKLYSDLHRAKEQAEAANEAKSRFLSNMSHEVRTPLNAVLGTITLLGDSSLDAEQQRYIETAQRSGETLLRIINDVLDFSRVEAGKLEMEAVAFAPGQVISDVTELLAPEAQRKGLDLAHGPLELPRVLQGDPNRLMQVLMNLVSNAIKFTEQGRICISSQTLARAGGRARIRIEVQDTGIGIPADMRPQLFREFVQADPSHARQYNGLGLGLAISKRLVELMDGHIDVDSILGEGSRFYFEIELPELSTEVLQVREQGASLGEARREGRILLAEDSPASRLVASAMLRNWGFRVDIAENGVAAVAAAAHGSYDAVLMDISMPQMDGVEATRRIRALGGAAGRVPVIAMTASAIAGERDRLLEAGMNDYVGKPVDRKLLLQALDRWLMQPDEKVPVSAEPLPPATGVASQEALLDQETLAGLAQLAATQGPDALGVLIDSFAAEVRLRCTEIGAAAAARDRESLMDAAHALKGSALTYGAVALSDCTRKLEAAVREGDMDSAVALAGTISGLTENSLATLAAWGGAQATSA